MAYRALPRFLFRAPLLPVRAAMGSADALAKHPLGAAAISLASPELAKAQGARARLALDRYRRRAAFRPTPAGLLAGVGVGTLAQRTQLHTGQATAVFRLRWQRLAELARALLDLPELLPAVRVRRAPSVLLGTRVVTWLGGGQHAGGDDGSFVEERRADLDDLLGAALDATVDWTPWPVVRGAIREVDDGGADDGELDDVLRTMIDDGLLHSELTPPLVGPPAGTWLHERLSAIPAAGQFVGPLAAVEAAVTAGDWAGAQTLARGLPGARDPIAVVEATLTYSAPRSATLDRNAVARAAALAPLLFRLQEALAPPASERSPAPALAEALDATTEIFGAGALDLAALTRGDYGVEPGESEPDELSPASPSPGAAGIARALYTFLIERLLEAARTGSTEVALRADELAALLPDGAPPPTCELFLTPGRPRPGARPGTGWLLGLHAPAGASWGRFAFALGDAAAPLFAALREAEARARPGEEHLDVVFAPSARLADICAHPAVRATALALTGWPAAEQAALTVADLHLVADPSALEPLALRSVGGQPVSPSPLHRVRSTTAPPGVWRLLAGWNLFRQHAPWALQLGALGDLGFTPRLSIDGFVVAPASWRVPAAPRAGRLSARALAAWRREAGVPRFVQVGLEDELLPVDLSAPRAAADLAGARRVYEIWPPLGDTPDGSGRRVEAVVALADQPDSDAAAATAAGIAATADAGRVVWPVPAAELWCTFKLFGAADRQDQVLLEAVEPTVRHARGAGAITDWFFLRYIDGPGRRPHLRVRARLTDRQHEAAFARWLEEQLGPAFAAGDVVSVERAPYFPEVSRYGGPAAMPAIHHLFGADSALACELLTLLSEPEDPLELADAPDARSALLVCGFDALARAFELDGPTRRQLAMRRLDAHAPPSPDPAARTAEQEQGRAFRAMGRRLRALVGEPPPALAAAIERFEQSARTAARRLDAPTRARVLPALLHLGAVRLAGPDRDAEILAYAFWARVLDSLAHHRVA